MYSKEIKGSWHGVILPEFIRAFDCRHEDKEYNRTPEGRWLLSSDCAAADLGILGEDTRPVSCSTYIDARTAEESELRRQVTSMVAEAWRMKAEYDKVKRHPGKDKGHGGSVLYLPLAIVLSNFGWCVLCDSRVSVVKRFT